MVGMGGLPPDTGWLLIGVAVVWYEDIVDVVWDLAGYLVMEDRAVEDRYWEDG